MAEVCGTLSDHILTEKSTTKETEAAAIQVKTEGYDCMPQLQVPTSRLPVKHTAFC